METGFHALGVALGDGSSSSHLHCQARPLKSQAMKVREEVPQEPPPFTHLAVTKTERRMDSRAFGVHSRTVRREQEVSR